MCSSLSLSLSLLISDSAEESERERKSETRALERTASEKETFSLIIPILVQTVLIIARFLLSVSLALPRQLWAAI